MCGRIKQAELPDEYFATIFPNMHKIFKLEPGLRFNVPPGSTPMVIHELGSVRTIERQFWGYKPVWYKRKPVINARLDKIVDGSKFWTPLVEHGRMIVPAEGWFEWTGEKDDKQPWFIRPVDGKPILMATISAWKEGAEPGEQHGVAIVTDDSAGGMVDVCTTGALWF